MILKEARFYSKLENNKVKCELCPHACIIAPEKYGICKVRKNDNGTLNSDTYGIVSSVGFDPIEKKPLYHFFPGSYILSIGSLGCNMKCNFCQNYEISQASCASFSRNTIQYLPADIIQMAISREDNKSIAFTYNEPTVFYEFMQDIAIQAKEQGLYTVMVSNAFINKSPLLELIPYIDAFSIDLKGYNETFYRDITNASLKPILESIKTISKNNKHLEITNLIIPGLNDDLAEFETMVKWLAENAGTETVLHISRYYPRYQSTVEPTPLSTLNILKEIADNYLNHVYLGNVNLENGNNTFCPKCNTQVINRFGYFTNVKNLDENGNCKNCGHKVLNFV